MDLFTISSETNLPKTKVSIDAKSYRILLNPEKFCSCGFDFILLLKSDPGDFKMEFALPNYLLDENFRMILMHSKLCGIPQNSECADLTT